MRFTKSIDYKSTGDIYEIEYRIDTDEGTVILTPKDWEILKSLLDLEFCHHV